MVHGRTRKRKAERHVDGMTETRRLEHGQALVVIHRDHDVVMANVVGDEQRIGGQRTDDAAQSVGTRVGNGRPACGC